MWIVVLEQGVGLTLDSCIEFWLRRHGVQGEAERISKVHASNQRCR